MNCWNCRLVGLCCGSVSQIRSPLLLQFPELEQPPEKVCSRPKIVTDLVSQRAAAVVGRRRLRSCRSPNRESRSRS